MRRPISRTGHGIVDYTVAAIEGALARTLPASPGVQRLLGLSAANALLLALLTRYELGLVKVLPMRAHLVLDGIFAATFLAAPLAADEHDPRSVRVALAALGAAGAATALLTDPDRA